MRMRRFNKELTIQRSTKGSLNAAGEPLEDWTTVTGGSNVPCNFQQLPVGVAAALARDIPGQVRLSSHKVIFIVGLDIEVDDRLLDSDGNYYVVQHVYRLKTYYEVTVSITNRQV